MPDRPLLALSLLTIAMRPPSGCSEGLLEGTSASSPPPPAVWVELESTRPDLQERVAQHAREATRRGMVPIVHLRPRWNWYLGRGYDTPEVQRAARGAYIVGINIGLPGDTSWPALKHSQCNALHQSLIALDADGQLAMPMAIPGTKEGPATPADYAAFLGIYLERLRSSSSLMPFDPTQCDESLIPIRQWRAEQDIPPHLR